MEEFTENQQFNEFENPAPKRPNGLTVACVLSFISAGWFALGNLITFLSYNVMKSLTTDENYLEMMEKFVPDMDEFEATMEAQFAVSRVSYLLQALLYIGSFIGVLYMWRLQKKGFHIYAISQLLLLIVTAVFVTSVTGASIWGSVILTAIWIGIYFIYYKKTLQ
ncbi:MAG: hypothetical protein K6A73_07460 [Bacteroidales bacterium]|nr:hypothetical protein [Bacteroidales bacterium]